MLKIRDVLVVLAMLLFPLASPAAQWSISIGINLSTYPQLVAVPGYPVYYAPRLESNYFFYDGMYWVYQDDSWYASSWYNGPWVVVYPEAVPVFILRIPVRYYRRPPAYFRDWRSDAPPRWGDHWGRGWEQRRGGWDRWDRGSTPAAAPLPIYQQRYSGERYPRQVEQQHELQQQNYRYEPRDPEVRQHYQEPAAQKAPAQQEQSRQLKPQAPEVRDSRQQDVRRVEPRQPDVPAATRSQPPQRGGMEMQRVTPASPPQARPEAQERKPQEMREQPARKLQEQQERKPGKRDPAREPRRGDAQEGDRDRGE